MWYVRSSFIITFFSAYLLSGCSLAPNGPTNRIRISLPGGSSLSKDTRKASHLFAGFRGLERIQEMLGIKMLEAANVLPAGLPTTSPGSVPTSPTGYQCFGINVTGPGIIPGPGIPKDSCVPSNMPGSGIYGGLVYTATGGEIDVDVPPGPSRTIQVFGIQTDGYCPSIPEITSQPLGMHPFQYAYELGRSTVDVVDDTTVKISLSSNSSNAQRMFCDLSSTSAFTRQWTRQVGAAGATTTALGFAIDPNANVYMAGTTNTAIDGNTQSGYQDYYLTKYDSSGTHLWTKQGGLALKTTNAAGVATDLSGNIYVAGSTNGGLDGNSLMGTIDFFVTKYSSGGTRQWTKQLGVLSKTTKASSVAVDSSGNVYVAGYTNGGLDGNSLMGAQDFFVTKYDTSGTKLWTKQLGATSTTTFSSGVAMDASGNVYISGYTNGGLDGNSITGTEDAFITKYDSTGTKQWTRQLGATTRGTYADGITVDSSGNIFLAGNTNGNLGGNTLTGNQDSFIAKYDSTGNRQWIRQLGVISQSTTANGITVDSSGNAYITGVTGGALDGQTLFGISDIFFTKYDSSGLRQWTIQNGTTGANVVGNFIAIDSSSHIYVGGTTDHGIDGIPALGLTASFFSKY
jgi:outer membrane protein assembly factor BamB